MVYVSQEELEAVHVPLFYGIYSIEIEKKIGFFYSGILLFFKDITRKLIEITSLLMQFPDPENHRKK